MDITNTPKSAENCPDCGAPLVGGAKECWLCRSKRTGSPASLPPADLRSVPNVENPYASPGLPADWHLNRTFSLSTMFLWTTLLAVVMGVATFAPGLAIALAVISFPAALRTIGTVARRTQLRGVSLSVPEKIEAFVASLGVVLAIAVGAGIAFMAVCLPVGMAAAAANVGGEFGFFVPAVIAGTMAAGAAAFLLGRRIWPQKD
jgi:hypothetical protein